MANTKLPDMYWGGFGDLAEKLGKPLSTVYTWRQYGVPAEHRAAVDEAVRELLAARSPKPEPEKPEPKADPGGPEFSNPWLRPEWR